MRSPQEYREDFSFVSIGANEDGDGVQLKLLKCDWGMEHLGDQRARLRQYSAAGYDGVECAFIEMDPSEFADLCAELRLDYVAMMFCDEEAAFEAQLGNIREARPLLINCHPGRDRYDFQRGLGFFRATMAMASELAVEVVYETHRTRLLYAPWTTARYLEALPELRLCADFSHFTTVAEGTMEDPGYAEMMDLAISRADHIHARVGHAHGPQVADPRSDLDMRWTRRFEGWWDRIVSARKAEGRAFLTVTPEYGPPPYQPVDCRTGKPQADVWEVCAWMTERFRQRWAGRL